MTFKRGGKTGYPAGLLQDDDSQLSKWFASKPDARYIVRKNIQERNNENLQSVGKTDNAPLRLRGG
jgi:hypothetical protein